MAFLVKNRKAKHLQNGISLGTKFHFQQTILNFWKFSDFPQKSFSNLKHETVNITINFCIFHLFWTSSFTTNWQFKFFGPRFLKKSTSSQKTEHQHSILFDWIRLRTKNTLKKRIWVFGPGLPQKGISNLKHENPTSPLNSAYSN